MSPDSNPDAASERQSAQADLAFLRTLVDAGNGWQVAFGETYLAGGLLYGLQTVGYIIMGLGGLPNTSAVGMTLGIAPTVVFVAILVWISWRYRRVRQGGLVGRAVGVTFGMLGFANLALIVIIGSVALRVHSLQVWLIYPCVVFVLQGVAWLVAAALRRHLWLLGVGLGWVVAGVVTSFLLDSPYIVLPIGAALFGLMAIPGAVVIHLARRDR